MADNHDSFVEGPSMVLDKSEKEVFKYLLLNIFSYYIIKNYKGKIPTDWAGIIYEDHENKRRAKEKTRKSDSFAVYVLEWPKELRVGFYRAYFDARIFHSEFKTELDAIIQRHNHGINSISDISHELTEEFLASDKQIALDENQLEKSKVKADKVMELVINSKKRK